MAPVYFHAGLEKTGSTALQKEFSRKRELFLANHLLYPGASLKHRFLKKIGRDEAGLNKRDDISPEIFDRFDNLKIQWKNTSYEAMLLSEETTSRLSKEEIFGIKAVLDELSDETRCLVYVRHPVPHAVSAAMQQLKARKKTLAELDARPPAPAIRLKLERLIDAFGRERMIVRVYDPKTLSKGSIQHDVLDAMRYTGDRSFVESLRSNEALSLPAAMVLSATTSRNPPRAGPANRKAHHARIRALATIPGPRFTLPKAALERTREETAPDLDWLEGEFGIVLPEPKVTPREELRLNFTEEEAMATSLRMFPTL